MLINNVEKFDLSCNELKKLIGDRANTLFEVVGARIQTQATACREYQLEGAGPKNKKTSAREIL